MIIINELLTSRSLIIVDNNAIEALQRQQQLQQAVEGELEAGPAIDAATSTFTFNSTRLSPLETQSDVSLSFAKIPPTRTKLWPI